MRRAKSLAWWSNDAGRSCPDPPQAVACWPEFTSDRYTVVAEIGRGGMGSVYLARDEALGRDVAIKAANAVASSDVERRVRNEARILASLEHPASFRSTTSAGWPTGVCST